MIKARPLFLVVFLALMCQVPKTLLAEFKLVDAIQEFGEKRFIKPLPVRTKVGPLRPHAILRTQTEYDSNILYDDKDPRSDIVWDVIPGAIVEIPINQHQITLGYEADIEWFTNSRNKRQNDQNQDFFTLADFHFPSWYVNVFERFSETSSRSGTTFTSRIPRYEQVVHPRIGYRWKRTTFEAGFRHFYRAFRRSVDKSLDFQVREWTGVIYYDLFARLKALVDYSIGEIDYRRDHSRNALAQQVRVGFEGEILPNLMTKLRVGPQFRNYYKSGKPDFDSWVAFFSTEYQMRKDLKFHFIFKREPVEATFNEVSFYKQHSFTLGGEYEFRPRWILFSTNKYYRQDYATDTFTTSQTRAVRHDNNISLADGIRYLFREWWELELSYHFAVRESNFEAFDYTDHRITLANAITY